MLTFTLTKGTKLYRLKLMKPISYHIVLCIQKDKEVTEKVILQLSFGVTH